MLGKNTSKRALWERGEQIPFQRIYRSVVVSRTGRETVTLTHPPPPSLEHNTCSSIVVRISMSFFVFLRCQPVWSGQMQLAVFVARSRCKQDSGNVDSIDPVVIQSCTTGAYILYVSVSLVFLLFVHLNFHAQCFYFFFPVPPPKKCQNYYKTVLFLMCVKFIITVH